jgi:hypothetical protein
MTFLFATKEIWRKIWRTLVVLIRMRNTSRARINLGRDSLVNENLTILGPKSGKCGNWYGREAGQLADSSLD